MFTWQLFDNVRPLRSQLTTPKPDAPGHSPNAAAVDDDVYALYVNKSVSAPDGQSSQSPTVVLVHGMVVSSTYMLPLAEWLAPFFHVYLPDLPGYGRSNRLLPSGCCLSVGDAADVLAGWLDCAGLVRAGSTAPFFIGNSMGCQVIAELARRHPSHIQAGVLQGPTKGSRQQAAWQQVVQWMWNGRNERPSMTRIMLHDYAKAGFSRSWATLRRTRDYNIEEVLPHCRVPLMIVNGELDNVSPVEWGALLVRSNSAQLSQLILLDATHTANHKTPRSLAFACREYFLGLPSPTPPQMDIAHRITMSDIAEFLLESCAALALPLTLLLALMCSLSSTWWALCCVAMLSVLLHTAWRAWNRSRIFAFSKRSQVPIWSNERYSLPIPAVADFDSATAFLRATALFLRGDSFPHLGRRPLPCETWLTWILSKMPEPLRNSVYAEIGVMEAVPESQAAQRINSDNVADAVAGQYPMNRRYPAIAIGSSCGALVHLYAALQIPWLPQTLLFPIKRALPTPRRPPFAGLTDRQDRAVFDLTAEMEWGQRVGAAVLRANPAFQLHHMADPNQDALMTRGMSYFRMKYRKLPQAYSRFIRSHLQPNGTILLIDCRKTWHAVQVAAHHYFQIGAVGGLPADQYITPNAQVDRFIRREVLRLSEKSIKSPTPYLHWNSPQPDCQPPEAEWGFEAELQRDIEAFAREHSYDVRCVVFDDPQALSGVVADLYREWYARDRSMDPLRNHLFVESFILIEPWWCLRNGYVPYWAVFSVEPAAEALKRYLERNERTVMPFDTASTTLFPHGVRSVGYWPAGSWKALLRRYGARAGHNAEARLLIGVNEDLFPADFQALVRYHSEASSCSDARFIIRALDFPVFCEWMNKACVRHLQANDSSAAATRREWAFVGTQQ